MPLHHPAPIDSLAQVRELLELGRRYETFAQSNPAEAEAQIAELNEPGLKEHAWDLTWLPATLLPRIARISSVLVLNLCRPPSDPKHDPALMDVIMPAAIIAACVVGDTYGAVPILPAGPRGPLATFATLLRRVTLENPQELVALALRSTTSTAFAEFPILACIPLPVRDRLIGLSQILGEVNDPLRRTILTVIFTIGAVASEKFEPLAL